MLQNGSMSRVIGTALSNRYNRQSRKNQLPKIGRTIEIRGSSLRETLNLGHLLEAADYQYLSDASIQQEYELLRQQLLRVNETAAKQVQALQHRNMRKSFVSESAGYRLQLLDEELKNNNAIILRLAIQNKKMTERLSYLQGLQREELEDQIEEQTKVLLRCKQQNKRMSWKSQQEGKLFEISEYELDQIKKLEHERSLIEKKKRKLEKRSEEVIEGTKRVIQKLQAIGYFTRQADEMIEEGLSQQKDRKEQERQEAKLRQKEKNINVLTCSIESIRNLKEMTFKKSRDRLEQMNLRISLLEEEIRERQQDLLRSKNSLVETTQQWTKVKQRPMRMTEVEPLETEIPKENKVNSRVHNRATGLKTVKQRNARKTETKIKKDIDSMLQSSQTATTGPVKPSSKPKIIQPENVSDSADKKAEKDARLDIGPMAQVGKMKVQMSKQVNASSIQNKVKSRTVNKIDKVLEQKHKSNLKEHVSKEIPSSQDIQSVGRLEMSFDPQAGGQSLEEERPFEQIVKDQKEKLSERFEVQVQLEDLHKNIEKIKEVGEKNGVQFKISDDQSIE